MAATTLQELRDLSPQELRNRATELKQTLFDLRNKANTGVLDSTADLLKTKRDIARCLTVAREKELAEARGATPQGAPKGKAATPQRIELGAKE
jgi:large subunit ribosomal protein L29